MIATLSLIPPKPPERMIAFSKYIINGVLYGLAIEVIAADDLTRLGKICYQLVENGFVRMFGVEIHEIDFWCKWCDCQAIALVTLNARHAASTLNVLGKDVLKRRTRARYKSRMISMN